MWTKATGSRGDDPTKVPTEAEQKAAPMEVEGDAVKLLKEAEAVHAEKAVDPVPEPKASKVVVAEAASEPNWEMPREMPARGCHRRCFSRCARSTQSIGGTIQTGHPRMMSASSMA